MKNPSVVLKSGVFLCALTAVVTLMTPSIGAAQDAKPEVAAEAPKGAEAEAPAKFYSSYSTLIDAANGKLPVEQGPEFAGSSMLPFGSRNKAIDEAKANALQSSYKLFVLTYDREERQQTALIAGIARIVKLRGVELVDKTPDNVMKLLEKNAPKPIHGLLLTTLKQPEFAALTPRLKEFVREDRNETRGGFSMGLVVQALVAQEGKALIEDLKKWSKYHRSSNVRLDSSVGLIQLGEVAFVEEGLKSEQDKSMKFMLEEMVRKARMGA